jgi:glycosyltransferase involved in cell wall biosynthesis
VAGEPVRALTIGIDGRELLGRPTGVGRYLVEVLRQWTSDSSFPHRLLVVLPASPPELTRALFGDRVEWLIEGSGRPGTWWEQRHLPRALRRARADVLFAVGYTAPLASPCPFVVVLHDVSFAAHPEWFSWREGVRRRWLSRLSARRASTVVTVSAFSAAEIGRCIGIPASRIILAPPGAPEWAGPQPARREPTVLYVGSIFNRRRIPLLIEGFAVAASRVPGARLVMVGDNRTRPHVEPLALAQQAGVADRVEWREYVSDADLTSLYQRASVFVFLSAYEGFAMTPLEAAAHGVPSVLADTPIAREIYGGGADLVRADAAAVGDAIATLLTDEDARLSASMRARGLLEKYTWQRTAATLRHALERAATGAEAP